MRPFIIEIDIQKENCPVTYQINRTHHAEHIEYEVLCGDSLNAEYELFNGDFIHTFKHPGKYRISFRGNLPGLFLKDTADYHLLDVCQWGDICWRNMNKMFSGCACFNISAGDQPDLSKVTSLEKMFEDARCLNAPLENWDVSNITNMSEMFANAE